MRIVLLANGVIRNIAEEIERWIRPGDLIAAADGGALHALRAGLIPAQIIGDLDSLAEPCLDELRARGATIHRYPAAKDETDLELALVWAAAQDADEIIVLGALGGRPDHELANLMLLAHPALDARPVLYAEGEWRVRLLRAGQALRIDGCTGDTVSLIPLGGTAEGIHTGGLAYPLRGEALRVGPARGVSNVISKLPAVVSLEKGLLLVFHEAQISPVASTESIS